MVVGAGGGVRRRGRRGGVVPAPAPAPPAAAAAAPAAPARAARPAGLRRETRRAPGHGMTKRRRETPNTYAPIDKYTTLKYEQFYFVVSYGPRLIS